jgi:hypothetical protein
MIVIHNQQKQDDANNPAQCGRRERPLIDGYSEELENDVADRNID